MIKVMFDVLWPISGVPPPSERASFLSPGISGTSGTIGSHGIPTGSVGPAFPRSGVWTSFVVRGVAGASPCIAHNWRAGGRKIIHYVDLRGHKSSNLLLIYCSQTICRAMCRFLYEYHDVKNRIIAHTTPPQVHALSSTPLKKQNHFRNVNTTWEELYISNDEFWGGCF